MTVASSGRALRNFRASVTLSRPISVYRSSGSTSTHVDPKIWEYNSKMSCNVVLKFPLKRFTERNSFKAAL